MDIKRPKLILRNSRIVSDVSFSSPDHEHSFFLSVPARRSSESSKTDDRPHETCTQKDRNSGEASAGRRDNRKFLVKHLDYSDYDTVEIVNASDPCAVDNHAPFPDSDCVSPAAKAQKPISTTEVIRISDKIPIFGFIDFFACFLSILAFSADVGSDIFVAVLYFKRKEYWFFGFTVSFIVIPALTTTLFSVAWYCQDRRNHNLIDHVISKKTWCFRAIFHVLQLGPIIRYINQSLPFCTCEWIACFDVFIGISILFAMEFTVGSTKARRE